MDYKEILNTLATHAGKNYKSLDKITDPVARSEMQSLRNIMSHNAKVFQELIEESLKLIPNSPLTLYIPKGVRFLDGSKTKFRQYLWIQLKEPQFLHSPISITAFANKDLFRITTEFVDEKATKQDKELYNKIFERQLNEPYFEYFYPRENRSCSYQEVSENKSNQKFQISRTINKNDFSTNDELKRIVAKAINYLIPIYQNIFSNDTSTSLPQPKKEGKQKEHDNQPQPVITGEKQNELAVLQKILFGAPGTGKSFKIDDSEKGYGLENVEESRKFRTTFHPDYDYAQFVGTYKPIKKVDNLDKITYDFIPQVFARAYTTAWKQYFSAGNALTAEDQVYLVIEEINRGNCAQIFGDIFQLLDRANEDSAKGFSHYSIDADYDFAKYIENELNAAGKWADYKSIVGEGKLKLPPNLNILATMNTSDQSLFPMDSAFKRRFDWEYVPINYKMPKADFKVGKDGLSFGWLHFLKKVNADIRTVTESEDKQMGEFFIKPKDNENIMLEEFRSKVLFYLWDTVYKDETDKKNLFHFPYPEKGPGITFQRLFEDDEAGKLSDNSKKIIRKMLETLDAAYDSEEYNDFKIFPVPAKPTEDK